MPYIEESIEKFNHLPAEVILEVDSVEIARRVHDINRKHGINIAGLIIQLAVGDVAPERMEKYLKVECGLGDVGARKAKMDIMDKIYNPLVQRLRFLNSSPNKDFPLEKEKAILMNIFEKRIMRELKKSPIIRDAVNYRIFYILNLELGFKDVLMKKLLKNEEKVTDKVFTLGGVPEVPNIKNWIDDFIKKHGSGIFTSIVLSDYLSGTDNTRRLDENEREMLKKVLLLYRNIVFFPESMPTDTGEGWEILPLGIEQDESLSEKGALSPPKTRQEKNIDILKEEKGKYKEGGLERKALEEGVSHEKALEDLTFEVNKYEEGSLERKVLEEQIMKMRQAGKK